jgi:hypothetical protein
MVFDGKPSNNVGTSSAQISGASTPISMTPAPNQHVLVQNMKLQIITDDITSDWEVSGRDQMYVYDSRLLQRPRSKNF